MQRALFQVGTEQLVGEVVAKEGQAIKILFLHGAGQSTRDRVKPLALELSEHGIGSFIFDFSGHGESTGTLGGSSLRKRIEEAKAALCYLDHDGPIMVCGFSMGGHVALELLHIEPRIDSLALFAPAVYARSAVEVGFSEGFSAIIRAPRSWEGTGVTEYLESFEGSLTIYMGEMDTVIPESVIELLQHSAQRAHSVTVVKVPGVVHELAAWMNSTPKALQGIAERIISSS